jgi:hypothetical protein
MRGRIGIVFLAAAVCGCGSSSGGAASTSAPRVFVGTVDGSDAQVAVIATEHHARVYFCGGDSSFATMTHWIPSASLDPAAGTLSDDGSTGWTVSGHLDDTTVTGSVMAGGQGPYAFHATPVAAGTIAGLYDAFPPCGHVGVIVTQGSASDMPEEQGACLPSANSTASTEQVNPIRPIERAADGTIAVSVGGATSFVKAATPPAE